MSRKPYRVHQWTVGSRFSVPVPTGNVLDFTIEREPTTGQLFCAWAEDRGEGHVTVRWSRAPELYAAWRKPNSVAHLHGDVFDLEIKFAEDRVLLTYLRSSTRRAASAGGECMLHWKRITGGPWSEGVTVRAFVANQPVDATFPYLRRLHSTTDTDGRNWALVSNRRFVEPTYSLFPLNAPERALLPPNPWEDNLIYTGILAGAADRAHLVWDRGAWHVIRRHFDDNIDGYALEAIALDMSILRHDQNQDGQSDIVDAISEIYDEDLTYMLWAETDLAHLHREAGTVVAVRHPNQRTGRVDPSAKHVFETASSLAFTREVHPRGTPPRLEIVGRGQQIPIESIRLASSPVASATGWQQYKPDSQTYAVECQLKDQARAWLTRGMVVAEAGVFSNASSFEAIVEWRVNPIPAAWRGWAHVVGHSYAVDVVGVEPLSAPSRYRTASWIGKLYTHRIFANLSEHAPLTRGLRIPLLQSEADNRFRVVGIAEVVSFE